MSHLHGRGQAGGGGGVGGVEKGRASGPREKGQRAEGVHHSEVSEPPLVARRSRRGGEVRQGGTDADTEGGGVEVGGRGFKASSAYWSPAKSS